MVGQALQATHEALHTEAGPAHLGLHQRGSPLSLYLDSSALAKLFLDEPGSPAVVDAVEDAGVRATSRLSFVECSAAFARAHHEGRATRTQLAHVLEAFDAAWQGLVVVELDERIAASAVDIARDHTVRAADAIHLASALAVAPEGIAITFACFDRRLWDAASGFALKRLPTEL